jgi:hypothetical protein
LASIEKNSFQSRVKNFAPTALAAFRGAHVVVHSGSNVFFPLYIYTRSWNFALPNFCYRCHCDSIQHRDIMAGTRGLKELKTKTASCVSREFMVIWATSVLFGAVSLLLYHRSFEAKERSTARPVLVYLKPPKTGSTSISRFLALIRGGAEMHRRVQPANNDYLLADNIHAGADTLVAHRTYLKTRNWLRYRNIPVVWITSTREPRLRIMSIYRHALTTCAQRNLTQPSFRDWLLTWPRDQLYRYYTGNPLNCSQSNFENIRSAVFDLAVEMDVVLDVDHWNQSAFLLERALHTKLPSSLLSHANSHRGVNNGREPDEVEREMAEPEALKELETAAWCERNLHLAMLHSLFVKYSTLSGHSCFEERYNSYNDCLQTN